MGGWNIGLPMQSPEASAYEGKIKL